MTARPRLLPALVLSTLAACAGSSAKSGGGAPAPVAAPKPFEYTPTSGQYRYTSEGKNTQGVNGQTRESSTSAMRLMTISVAHTTPDTVTMTLVIDSITTSNSMGTPTLGLDKVPGSKYTVKLAPNGSFYSATGPSETENKVAFDMTDEVVRALPRLNATLRAGAAWTDTVNDKVRQNGLVVSREIVTKFQVVGDTTVGGEAAWKVQRESSLKATGAGTLPPPVSQPATVDLTGSGKGVLIVSKRGVLLGGVSDESNGGTLVLTAMNLPVSLTGSATSKFTKVK